MCSSDLPQRRMFRSPDHYGYLTAVCTLTRGFTASLFGNYTGGLVGQIDPNDALGVKTEIIGCVNTGKVTGGCNVGGVAGMINSKGGSLLIESCRNLGNVHATNTADVQNAGGTSRSRRPSSWRQWPC